MSYLFIGVGGFLGAISRYFFYQIEKSLWPNAFPLATLGVNTLGCLLAGLAFGLIQEASPYRQQLNFLLVVGFLGSFTTFSTFGVDNYKMIIDQNWVLLGLNLLLNIGLGLLGVTLGVTLSTKLFS